MPGQTRVALLLSAGMLGCLQVTAQTPASDVGVTEVGRDASSDAAVPADASPPADAASSPDTGPDDASLVWTFDAGPPTKGTGHCTAKGWCFELPLPYGFDQESLWAASSKDVWVTTLSEEVLHFDGTEWKEFPIPEPLTSVGGSASDNVWAIGRTSFWRLNGTAWEKHPLPPSSAGSPYHMAVRSPTEVWVTTPWELWRWDGSKWNLTPGPDYTFARVVANANQVWLWPARNWSPRYETIAQWDGSGWVEQPAALSLFSLWPTTEVLWALESKEAPIGMIGRCKLARRALPNGAWETGAEDLCGTIWSSSDSDVWRMTYQGVQRWDGKQFQPEPLRPTTGLMAIGGTSAQDVWTVGAGGYRAHFDGAKWTETRPAGLLSGQISDLACTTAGNWAVVDRAAAATSFSSEQSFGLILHDDGTGWRIEAETGPGLERLHEVDGEVWALGWGTLFHRAGGWHLEDLGPRKCNSVWMAAADDGWAGCEDALMHYDGKIWSPVPGAPAGEVWGTSAADLWVMQGDPVVLYHWNGATWTETTPGKASSGSLFGSPNDIWFVGDSFPGKAWRWNGSTWVDAPTPTQARRVQVRGTDDVWALGLDGLKHWDGTRWTPEYPGFGVSAFCVAPDGHFKVATWGYSVGILRR